MAKPLHLLLSLSLALLCAACTDSAASLTDKRWVLVELRGQPLVADGEDAPYVELSANGTYSGRDGCNGFSGMYTLSGTTGLQLELTNSTLVYCQYAGYDGVFDETDSFTLSADRLALLSVGSPTPLAVFRAEP